MVSIKSNKCWQTTIDELINIFRGSLLSILPSIQRAHIPWKNEETYDDWDMISETLFHAIVVRSILYSLNIEIHLPKYGFYYNSYKKFDYIIVETNEKDKTRKVFVSFYTKVNPFDYVEVAVIDKNENVIDNKYYNYEDCSFNLVIKSSDKKMVIENICVEL